ncbi:MAG: ABC transporter ATP-binding protein [Chloroflexi bacterium]|nr:ABC transporter ATP-binding protein [Chloroflexota bacterium]
MTVSATHTVGDLESSAKNRNVVLDIRNLKVYYATPTGNVRAVDDVSFQVYESEIIGLVGESGCGKTTTAMAILRLVQPPGRITGGQILLDGTDLASLHGQALRDVRWNQMALIPQGAMNSLNPVMKINRQIADAIEAHEGRQPAKELKERIINLLATVGLPSRVYGMYPHELSGGMKQRACIAMAIALHPSLVIADEPTSALDVVVQRVVGETLLDVKERLGVSMIVIGHDMGLMAQLVDRLAVMYAGRMVEIAPVETVFHEPLHPYTQLLIESIPSIKQRKPLKLTEGLTHDLRNPPPGCIFQLRCPHVTDICREVNPPLRELRSRHFVACHLYE